MRAVSRAANRINEAQAYHCAGKSRGGESAAHLCQSRQPSRKIAPAFGYSCYCHLSPRLSAEDIARKSESLGGFVFRQTYNGDFGNLSLSHTICQNRRAAAASWRCVPQGKGATTRMVGGVGRALPDDQKRMSGRARPTLQFGNVSAPVRVVSRSVGK